MALYGNDKPDLRFEMKIIDFTGIFSKQGFSYFDEAETIMGIKVPQDLSRKQIDKLIAWARTPQIGGSTLVSYKIPDKNTIKKFYTPEDLEKSLGFLEVKDGETLLLIAGDKSKAQNILGRLRLKLGEELNLIEKESFKPLWVIDFPLFEWSEVENRYKAMHHPFTAPSGDLNGNLDTLKAKAYDLVINGQEVGGGSIRIHNKEEQMKVLSLLGISEEESEEQFGFLMEAFEFGAPPHGGIAFGLDRLCAILSGSDTIRDFIAFPKNNKGRDTMLDAPSFIEKENTLPFIEENDDLCL
jgi:aspartyl-tRNA synthetase